MREKETTRLRKTEKNRSKSLALFLSLGFSILLRSSFFKKKRKEKGKKIL